MSEEPLYEKMSKTCGESVADLIRQHWPIIEQIAVASGKSKAAVSISIKFERVSADATKVKTAIRYAAKHADEREETVDTEDETKQPRLFKVKEGA